MKQKVLFGATAVFCILLCVFAKDSATAAREALTLCVQTVIPNLFPFFVLSSFMVSTGFVGALGQILSPVAKRLFRISGNGAVAFVIGLLCGSPTGAKTVAELYENKQIEREEAQQLLPFCNNAGPLFIMGAVGGMLGSKTAGMYLYLIHVLSAVGTGLVLSLFSKPSGGAKTPTLIAVRVSIAFSDAVCRSVITMLQVCGFIVFFSVIRAFYMPFLGQDPISLLIGGAAEISLGTEAICLADLPMKTKMILLSAVSGFGGVCVLLQVCGIVGAAGIPIKRYVLGKMLQAVIAAAIAAVLMQYWEDVPAFSHVNQQGTLSFLPFLFAGIFFCVLKLTKGAQKSIIRKKQKI